MKKQAIICLISLLAVLAADRILPHNMLCGAARIALGAVLIINTLLLMQKLNKKK